MKLFASLCIGVCVAAAVALLPWLLPALAGGAAFVSAYALLSSGDDHPQEPE